jgi:hypothetical protein
MELNSISDKYKLSFRSLNQYAVSLAYLRAIFILFKKSGLDCACTASLTKALIAVPLRTTCREKINSFFTVVKYLYKLDILTAKLYDFVPIILSIKKHLKDNLIKINNRKYMQNFQLVKKNSFSKRIINKIGIIGIYCSVYFGCPAILNSQFSILNYYEAF